MTIISLLCVNDSTLGQSLPANFRFPSVQVSEADQLVCYMHTSDGRVLDLDQLCSHKSTPRVVISNVLAQDDHLIGNVMNQTNRTVQNVQVNYEVRDRDGRVLERGSTPTDPSILNPGQTADFEFIATSSGTIRATSVNWSE